MAPSRTGWWPRCNRGDWLVASELLQRRVDRLLDEADQAITEEARSTVASRARAVLRIDPENSDAISYRPELLRSADNIIPAKLG